jgi:serine/threonine-protein kinase
MTLVGSTLGPYELVEELGHGGMGVVYRALDRPLQRTVALKVLAPRLLDDADARTRFQQEIKAAVAFEHPHIVPVYNAVYEDGYFFLAMRYVAGRDLWHLIHDIGPLPERRAMRLVGQIASALMMVHEQGMAHRDVKPQNVLVWNAEHPDEHAFLTDFGIAKALDETRGLTRMGAVGTPGYMAPELKRWERASPACDQFSLACLTYELLTGRLPFSEDAADGDPPEPIRLHASVSKQLAEALERALRPLPGERFATVQEFVAASDVALYAFDEARDVQRVLTAELTTSQRVTQLATVMGLGDALVAEVAGVSKAEVALARRRAARRSVIGEGP